MDKVYSLCYNVIMVRITNISIAPGTPEEDVRGIAAKKAGLSEASIRTFRIVKKSIDARKKQDVRVIYTVDISASYEPEPPVTFRKAERAPECPPVIIGAGPAGLFAALSLAEAGMKPVVLERGKSVDERKSEVDKFLKSGNLNPECNVQFGEGGAGTFSDGKLNTLVNGEYNDTVLRIFTECGAPEEIRYLNKPHIGTDKLTSVVATLRKRIEALGGVFYFDTKMTGIAVKGGRVAGVYAGGSLIEASAVVLAIGHSARDTFRGLYESGVFMEFKEFSCGFRIEHLRKFIDASQYGKFAPILPAADYKLVSHTKTGRPLYTFCMCPGGAVIPAASEEGGVVVNGMSCYARDMINSNSALLTNITARDCGSASPLAGMEYQRGLEQRAYDYGGGGYKAPVQLFKDFSEGKISRAFGSVLPSYAIGANFASLNKFFPEDITETVIAGIKDMGLRLRGFDAPGAVLTAVESRSSSPIRITRGENMQSISHPGLFPIGEGCGYSGGIMSSAMDGLKAAEAIMDLFSVK